MGELIVMDIDKLSEKKIAQSNSFVESPYAQEFTPTEIKILDIASASCRETDMVYVTNKSNKPFRFTTKTLAKLLNTSVSSLSHEAERLSLSIVKKFIHGRKMLSNGQVEFETIAIIPYTKYEGGVFEFELNYKLIPYFVKIEGAYTKFYLKYLSSLKSAYANKVYKLLYQYLRIGHRKFIIDDLKEQCGIKLDKYKNYGDFKRRVIDLSVTQINQLTDLEVSYDEIKEVNKIVAIKFYFNIKPNEKLIEINIPDVNPLIENDAVLETIFKNYKIEHKISTITKNELKKYLDLKGLTYVNGSIEYALKNAKTNFDKYLRDALANEWGIVKVQELLFEEDKKIKEAKKKEKDALKQIENEKLRKLRKDKIASDFNKLTTDEKTEIFKEMLDKLTKKLEIEQLTTVLQNQDEYIISYWAQKNNLQYDGFKQLQLSTTWKVI